MSVRGKIILGCGGLLACAIGGIWGWHIHASPLPLDVMDLDRSGIVSFGEAINSLDVGSQPFAQDPDCTEFYWLKDGMTAYVSCDGARRGP